jgi:glutathione S-transferase
MFWPMKLYYSPGACSISPHIALLEAQLPFELAQVDLRAKTVSSGEDYRDVNPKGYVPALVMDNGELLTEGAIIVQYIADQRPETNLAPPQGTLERYRLQEKLHFLATELHKASSPFYNPKATPEFKESLKERIVLRLGALSHMLQQQPYLMGEQFTVADGYAYYCLRSVQKLTGTDLSAWPNLQQYYARLSERPTVKAALEAEGLTS